MNSFNHYAYGAVGEWMYRYMTGIEPDEADPGFHHFFLKPQPDRRSYLPGGQSPITSASATYQSRYGTIASAWSVSDEENLVYRCTVPVGTTATLHFPAGSSETEVYESGEPAASAEGVTYVGYQDGCLVYELESGTYQFSTDKAANVQNTSFNVQEEAAIYDLSGRRVFRDTPLRGSGEGTVNGQLPKGIYIVARKSKGGGEVVNRKKILY
jgi:alpha-L-rhamnosidase